MLAAANLPPELLGACTATLSEPARLFSGTPIAARVLLGWIAALAPERRDRYYPAVVAGECMLAGCNLLDDIYDQDDPDQTRRRLLPAGSTLLSLAQEFMRRAEAPADRRLAAAAALAHGSRLTYAAHLRDYQLRGGPPADADTLLWIMRRRSGSLVAACCGAMALVAGGSWRQVGLAARFGRAFAVAAQLDDDLADRRIDAQGGRQTIPTLLATTTADATVDATTWVLIRHSLRTASAALARLEALVPPGATEELRQVLSSAVHQSALAGVGAAPAP